MKSTRKCTYIRSIQGVMKFVSIMFIFITALLGTHAHLQSQYTKCFDKIKPMLSVPYRSGGGNSFFVPDTAKEIYFVIISTLCFFLSVANIVFYSCKPDTSCNRKSVSLFDFGYHIASTCLLWAAGVVMIISAVDIYGINCTDQNNCQLYSEKIAAGIMAMVTGMFYSTVGMLVVLLKNDTKPGPDVFFVNNAFK